MKIDVLDHGFVRLVSYMQPAERAGYDLETVFKGYEQDTEMQRSWTGDLEIVRNARTSYNADWRPTEFGTGGPDSKDAKLIHYLWAHQHTSPFEAMVFTFEVQAPIFVFRQWHRHRTWSYNEVSARYTELPDLFYVPAVDQVRAQSQKNKQGRDGELPDEIVQAYRSRLMYFNQMAYDDYKNALEHGVARELARLVLPVNVYSRMFATVDLRNLFHFLTLRLDEHAQYEIRVYAQALLDLIRPIVPVAVEAWEETNAKQHQDR